MRSLVLGVAGGSGAGKTTLVRSLIEALDHPVATVAFDDYYRDQSHLPFTQRALVNYDHPDSLDVDLFTRHVAALRRGAVVDAPVYDFASHTRSARVRRVAPAPVVVVDGILLLVLAETRDLLDLAVYVTSPTEVRFARRLERDVVERGRHPASVEQQFATTVGPMHDRYVAPSQEHAEIIVAGDGELAANTAIVVTALGQLRSGGQHGRQQRDVRLLA